MASQTLRDSSDFNGLLFDYTCNQTQKSKLEGHKKALPIGKSL